MKLQDQWGIGGIVVGVMSTIITWVGVSDARKLAHENGSLDHPEIQIAVGDRRADEEILKIVSLIPKVCTADPILAELPISVKNAGNATAKNLQIIIGFPLIDGQSIVTDQDLSEIMEYSGSPVASVSRKVQDNGPFRYVTFEFDRVMPDMLVGVSELVEAPLPIPVDVSGKTKDNVDYSGSIIFEYSIELPVNIVYIDARGQSQYITRKIELQAIVADSLSDAAPKLNELAVSARKAEAEKTGALGRIYRKVFLQSTENMYVVEGKSDLCGASGSLVPRMRTSTISYNKY